jgi:hypothetical protein
VRQEFCRFLQPTVNRFDGKTDCSHHQWEAHYRAGERGARPAKGEDNREMIVKELAERAAATEKQQQIPGYHRRHNERQMNQRNCSPLITVERG